MKHTLLFLYFFYFLCKSLCNAHLVSASKTSVGFTVGVTSSSSSWNGGILVYPHVVTNIGNGYSPSTGKFTAPTDGKYVFFITVNAYGSNSLYLDIVHNGSRKVRTMSHSSASYQTGTNMAVLPLYKGDSVWVVYWSGKGYYAYDVPITTFSGFLLFWNWSWQKLKCIKCIKEKIHLFKIASLATR